VCLPGRSQRLLLAVFLPGQSTRLFKLPLGRDPDSTEALSPWRRPDSIHVPGEEALQPAPADDPVELRYRVRRVGED